MSTPDCTICLENIFPAECVSQTECSHSYHRNCLELWLFENTTCPLCRGSLGELPPHGTTVPSTQPEFTLRTQDDFHIGFVIITTLQGRPRRRVRRRMLLRDMYSHRSDRNYDN